jgi:hypothetical protein
MSKEENTVPPEGPSPSKISRRDALKRIASIGAIAALPAVATGCNLLSYNSMYGSSYSSYYYSYRGYYYYSGSYYSLQYYYTSLYSSMYDSSYSSSFL